MEETTHFGYQEVPRSEKVKKVADVFHSVADKYDVMNDLMSLGIHRLWKWFAIEMCAVKPGQVVLDIAGGTGDLSKRFSKLVGDEGHVYLADINYSMLDVGKRRLLDEGIMGNVSYIQMNAENLAFRDNTFDCITIAFGLRNVTDKERAIRSMYRVLKPGGRLMILEFSKPKVPGLQTIYDAYSFGVLPKLGKLVLGDSDSYQYLAESIRMHPDQDTLKQMVEQAGFEDCSYHNLTGGIVAVHRAYKY